jgi:hypothetical protein
MILSVANRHWAVIESRDVAMQDLTVIAEACSGRSACRAGADASRAVERAVRSVAEIGRRAREGLR